jgi:hypothetical protein
MRSELRLNDLKRREPGATRLVNVKLPVELTDAIDRVARNLGASKTEVVIALLNEGLATAKGAMKDFKLAPVDQQPRRRGRPPKI